MHCRAPESCKVKRSLGFKPHDVINCKEQTVLESIKDGFKGANMQTQHSVLGYKLIFIFMDINWQQKLMNQFIMIEMLTMKYKDYLNIFKAINQIHSHTKKSTKNL